MKVELLAHTAQPEKMVACAAKLCYSASGIDDLYNGLTDQKAARFVDMLSDLGHESPVEHVSFTFGIEGVSRAFLAQVTRHRLASYSVQSQRYVKEYDFRFVTPPEIEQDPGAQQVFLRAMNHALDAYNELAERLAAKHKQELLAQGLDDKQASIQAEKKAIEDARFVLPNACETKMVLTMNARSLRNFFRQRCCNRAQWEIRAVANEMLRLVIQIAPTLFRGAGPGCLTGVCPEGKMSCGKAKEVQAFYASLRPEEK